MKKNIFIIIMSMAIIVTLTSIATAADSIMKTTIDTAVTKMDKNGVEYVRLLVPETRTLGGIEYTVKVPVMCFADLAEKGKEFQKGDKLNAIVSGNEYNGRMSYTVISFIE